MNFFKGLIIFVFGAGAGVAGTYFYMKHKYEEPLEVYEYKAKEQPAKATASIPEPVAANETYTQMKPSLMDYYNSRKKEEVKKSEEISEENSYSKKEPPKFDNDVPAMIQADEFYEYPDYETSTLTFYMKDSVIADTADNILSREECVNALGEENLEIIFNNLNEAKVIYIRNDKRSTYYEVLFDNRRYAEAVKYNPNY